MKVLITGIAGALGRLVAARLAAGGHEVLGIDVRPWYHPPDGVRVLFGDGWGLIRASNTQPILVLRFEARSEKRLQEIRGELEGWLRGQGVTV